MWGLRAAETEIVNRGLGVRNPQEFVYSTLRSSFKRRIVKADNRAAGANANLEEGGEKESIEEHPPGRQCG